MAVLAPPDRPNAEPGAPGDDVDPANADDPHPDPPVRRQDGTEVRTGNDVPVPAVTAMFDEIAPVYDRVNTLLSFGADGRWRRAAVRATGVPPGGAVIDVACGTGKLAAELAEQVGPFGRVLAVDLSEGMIARGSEAFRDVVQLEFRCADALRLPVPDGQYDAATIAFGLRNLADFEAGFRELRRVVRPGGRVVCLELTTPRPRWWGRAFLAGFGRMAPLAGRLAGRAAAYRYLRASLDGFPDAEHLARTMRSAGLENVSLRRLGLGSIALHVGVVPAE
jgi:demethylmenaquinone methyltransferase/2-methoxy-6-polyprenyl-1,4-benzoquinol methylase